MSRRALSALGLLFACLPASALAATPYDDLAPGEWRVVSKNTIDEIDPCPNQDCSYSAVEGISGVINDWNGGAFATGYGTLGGLVVWGGGHNGYFGSEVYVFDLETGLWARASEPYDNGSSSVAPDCNDQGIYPDGSACPAHTYDRVDYHPGTNQFVILSGTPDPVCGGCDDGYVHSFDFDDGSWALGPKMPNMGPVTGALSAYDAGRDVFWFIGTYGTPPLRKYDPNAGAWTEHGTPLEYVEIDGAAIHDPDRDLLLYLDARGTAELYAFDLAAPEQTSVKLTTAGDTEIQGKDKLGFEWDPASGRAVAWDDGADVYVLEAPDGDWKTGTWTWTKHPPAASNSVTPKRGMNGTYSRFRYAPSVNAFVLVSFTDGDVWMYKLSDGPGTGPNTGGSGGTSGSAGAGASSGAGGNAGSGGASSGGTGAASGGTSGNAAEGEGSDDGGCGCRVGRTPSTHAGTWLALIGLMAALRRITSRRRPKLA